MKRRSFRISESQGELLQVVLLFFLSETEKYEELKRAFKAHRHFAKTLQEKLENYVWRIEE